jgi:hypothetical protein
MGSNKGTIVLALLVGVAVLVVLLPPFLAAGLHHWRHFRARGYRFRRRHRRH